MFAHRYLIAMFALLLIAFVILVKQLAVLLLIFPLIISSPRTGHYSGIFAGILCVFVSSVWYWIAQPASITADMWITGVVLFLCVGIGATYVSLLQEKSNKANEEIAHLKEKVMVLREERTSIKEAFPDYALVFDNNGKYLDAFSQFMSPTTQDYLIGSYVTDVYKILNSDVGDNILKTIHKTIETQTMQQLEYQVSTHNGLMKRWMQGNTAYFPNPRTGEPQVMWIARDITERKEIENALTTVQQIAQIGTWETDVKTGYVTWSDEMYRIYDITPEEFDHTVKFVMARFHPDDLEAFRDKLDQGINPYPTEYRIIRPDKSIRTVYAVGDTIYDNNNQLVKRVGLLQDITERRQAEQERIKLQIVQQRTSALRNLINDVTHDLMTPVTVIKTSLYILKSTSQNERVVRHLDKVETHINILQNIVESLLTVSYLDDLELDNVAFKSADLMLLLRSLCEQYRSIMSTKNQTLTVSLPDHPLMIRFDHNYMHQAISNLLNNAMQYTPEGGNIEFNVSREGDYIHMAVIDNGIGISDENLDQIFEPFYRVDKHRPSNGNSGLGLRISKLIVELHGGQIQVKSHLGEGSTFSLQLPII